jgi:signal transduction histidine kinase
LLQLQIDYASQDLNPELADSLKGQINRLSEYVETALLVARAERGDVPIKKEMLAVNDFFSELLEPYKLRAKRHRRDLVSNLSSTRKAKIDPKIVALIFNNLLSNAFYHGSGKIRIQIKDNRSSTLLSIANRVRDGAITNYLEGGTGMGLRTVQTLASVHGDLQVTTRQRNRIYGAAIRILHTSV